MGLELVSRSEILLFTLKLVSFRRGALSTYPAGINLSPELPLSEEFFGKIKERH